MPKSVNTFSEMNMDFSDFVKNPSMVRIAKNIRVIDLNSSTFAVTNIKGTEQAFTLRTGFLPLSVKTYDNIVYILSYNPTTVSYELGSFGSPDYSSQPVETPAGDPAVYNVYRPFNNLTDSLYSTDGNILNMPFTFDSIWSYGTGDQPVMEIQPEYDGSVNVVIVAKGSPPRIVNSGFYQNADGDFIVLEQRTGQANSNTYTRESLNKETKLILRSQKILKIAYNNIGTGGRLLGGNYRYMFSYQTEDFSGTDIVGESSVCQVFIGNVTGNIEGADQTKETGKRVVLDLSNIDTDFKYLKVYFRHDSGTDVETSLYYEIDRPIEITGSSMQFVHTGYEDTTEVSYEDINVDGYVIEAASAATQIDGYLLLGGIQGPTIDYDGFQTAVNEIVTSHISQSIPYSGGFLNQGYADPENTYKYLGYMRGETYPFGIRFVMKDGSLSPVFPIPGYDFLNSIGGADPLVAKGLVRFPDMQQSKFYDASEIKARALYLNFTDFYNNNEWVREKTLGFFIVRGERKKDLVSQGILLPTLRVPPIKHQIGNRYYYNEHKSSGSEGDFRHVPVIDGILEAWSRNVTNMPESEQRAVVDSATLELKDKYMPIYMIDPNAYDSGYNNVSVYDGAKWAFYSTDTVYNEAEMLTELSRPGLYMVQHAKNEHRVKGFINKYFQEAYDGTNTIVSSKQTGMFYDFQSFVTYYNTGNVKAVTASYIPGEVFETGSDFISKVQARFNFDLDINDGNGSNRIMPGNDDFDANGVKHNTFDVDMVLRPYFGIDYGAGLPVDAAAGIANPVGGNLRYYSYAIAPQRRSHTIGTDFENYNTLVNASFLVNIYPQEGPIADINNKYPDVNNVVYKQVGPRYEWSDVEGDKFINIYGGDTYIGKTYMRPARSGYEDKAFPILAQNINMGMVVSWMQESEVNPELRTVYNAGESSDRSFFPRFSTDIETYRGYRLKESGRYSQGYSQTMGAKSGFKIDDTSVFVRNDFYSRVAYSTRHVPNTFKNGYREFVLNSYQDYSVDMGRIVALENYRNMMYVIFEHGIGVGEINQRVQTGSDAAGSIFVEPGQVLSPKLGSVSKDIGSQDPHSVYRTPSGIYGIDRQRKKIWRISDRFEVISDQSVSSFLKKDPLSSPRTGHNPRYNEVLFSSGNWTLCYHEGLGKFISFYSFVPDLYAASANDMYTIKGEVGYSHDSDNTMEVYGSLEDCYVEFTVNQSPQMAKVFDYINIISNEVRPLKVEFFTYPDENTHEDTLNSAGMGQYSKVESGVRALTGDEKIYFRDKKFVVQVPNSEIYSSPLDKWSIGGRMRNKYLIVRVTYNTSEKLQLLSVITDFRYSAS